MLHVVNRTVVSQVRHTTSRQPTVTDGRDRDLRRRGRLTVILGFHAVGIVLGGSHFAPWVLWPCLGFVLVIMTLWVKRNFFERS